MPAFARERREPERKRLDDVGDRVLEVLDDDVFDFGRGELRLDVDGDAIVGRVVDDAHLIVRRLPGAEPDLDRLPFRTPYERSGTRSL